MDLLASELLIQCASVRMVSHNYERAPQQRARASLDAAHAVLDATPPWKSPCHQPLPMRIPCATPDLLLKHPDAAVATYKRRQMKHLKQVSEILTKMPKTLENYCKHMKHPDETLATYV